MQQGFLMEAAGYNPAVVIRVNHSAIPLHSIAILKLFNMNHSLKTHTAFTTAPAQQHSRKAVQQRPDEPQN
jgi:hypothetical protein